MYKESIGENGHTDHLPPLLGDHFNLLTTNTQDRSIYSGDVWSKGAFFPILEKDYFDDG